MNVIGRFTSAFLFAALLSSVSVAGTPDQKELFDKLLADVVLAEPTKRSPLVLKAAVLDKELAVGSTFNLYVKVHLSPGWHIYEYDPTDTFTVADLSLELPEGVVAAGSWKQPVSVPYPSDPEIFIYHGDMVFVRELKVEKPSPAGNQQIAVKFRYQTCDPNKCLPPRTDVDTVSIDVE